MTPENNTKRETYYQKVLALLERSAVLEPGRLMMVHRQFSSPVVYKILGYDFAFLRVESTGCAYGDRWPEEKAHVYRNHEEGKEAFLKWSDVGKIEPYTRLTLPTQEETDERIKAWYAARCGEHYPTYYNGEVHVFACYKEIDHKDEHSFHHSTTPPAHYDWAGIDPSVFDPYVPPPYGGSSKLTIKTTKKKVNK